MNRWTLFVGASILVGGLLIKLGAPIVPIGAGILLAGVVLWQSDRRARLHR